MTVNDNKIKPEILGHPCRKKISSKAGGKKAAYAMKNTGRTLKTGAKVGSAAVFKTLKHPFLVSQL